MLNLNIEKYDKIQLKNSFFGFFVYAIGDFLAQLILNNFSLTRSIGLGIIGASIYAIEIPIWFRFIENVRIKLKNKKKRKNIFLKIDNNLDYKFSPISKMLLATLYFNPLWVARHMFFIKLFSFIENGGSFNILDTFLEIIPLANISFTSTIIIVFIGNYIIHNKIALKYRFIGNAIFSSLLAMYYAISIVLFK